MNLPVRLAALFLLGAATCGPASAVDLPQRKPGLWEISMVVPGRTMPPIGVRMCIDSATDADMYKMGMAASQVGCSSTELHRNGDIMTSDAVCKRDQVRTNTHAVTKFTGDSAYHSDVTIKYDPPRNGRAETKMVHDAKWTGPCPADMQPGDVVMNNGFKLNVETMRDKN